MRFLIAGFGSIGRRHFRNLLALGERDICFYRSHQSTLPDEELQGFEVFTELEPALASSPDAVIVANPTALHLEVAIPAARAGCHLLLEKPVSHNLDGLDTLQSAVRAKRVHVLVGFQFRYHPGLKTVEKLLQNQAIGRPLAFRSHWGEYLPDWHPWEDFRRGYSARKDLGGGVVLTLSHPLDYLRWLLGEVHALWAFTGSESDLALEVEDTAEIGLQMAGGALGSVHLNFIQRPAAHTLDIIGPKGGLHWDNADGAVRLYRRSTSRREDFPPPPGFERNILFLEEMRHFLDVVQGRAVPTCNLTDGLKAMELAAAVYTSARDGKMVRV